MQAKFDIQATRDTPEVIFDPKNKRFEITGNSFPEDTTKFFFPIFDWIEKYRQSPNKTTHLVCKLDYFNSSSAKMLYNLFIEFEKLKEYETDVKISWYFEPEDKLIEEKGLEYKGILDIPFELIEIK